MNIGKREQIVIGAIAAILLIGVLHFFIFQPSAETFKNAKATRDQMAADIQSKKIIPQGSPILTQFTSDTNMYLKKLEEGINRLKMDQPECFIIPKVDELPGDAAAPGVPGAPAAAPTPAPVAIPGAPSATPDPRKDVQHQIAMKKAPQQMDLLMEEIAKLREAMKSKQPQLSFLMSNTPNSWNIPLQLPNNVQGGMLWDEVKTVADFKNMLDRIDKKAQNYLTNENFYKQSLLRLGIDLNFINGLNKFGEFVPIVCRMMFADMILKRMAASPTPVMVLGKPLTREDLFKYLQIDLEFDPLDGLNESKVYFLWEELRNLNFLIALAGKMGVKDITAVSFRGFGFIREMLKMDDPPDRPIVEPEKLLDDELDDKAALEAQALAGGGEMMYDEFGRPMLGGEGGGDPYGGNPPPGMMGGQPPDAMGGQGGGVPPWLQGGMGMMPGMPVTVPTAPQPQDLGYAVPVRISYVAPNTNGFAFLYEILREKPMAEMHRLVLRSTSTFTQEVARTLTVMPNPNSTDVEMTATVLFIPKLFNTLDTVRQMITELSAPAPGTPGALPVDGASVTSTTTVAATAVTTATAAAPVATPGAPQ